MLVKNYVFKYKSPTIPRFEKRVEEIKDATEKNDLIINYMSEATAYKDSIVSLFEDKEYVLDRFRKDVLCEVGFAIMNAETNNYTEDIYADRFWQFALDNMVDFNIIYSDSLQSMIDNMDKLHTLFLENPEDNDTEFDSTTKEPELYDTRALTIDDTPYILSVPNSTGTARIFISNNGNVVSYNNTRWELKVNNVVTKVCENIDAETLNWTTPTSTTIE